MLETTQFGGPAGVPLSNKKVDVHSYDYQMVYWRSYLHQLCQGEVHKKQPWWTSGFRVRYWGRIRCNPKSQHVIAPICRRFFERLKTKRLSWENNVTFSSFRHWTCILTMIKTKNVGRDPTSIHWSLHKVSASALPVLTARSRNASLHDEKNTLRPNQLQYPHYPRAILTYEPSMPGGNSASCKGICRFLSLQSGCRTWCYLKPGYGPTHPYINNVWSMILWYFVRLIILVLLVLSVGELFWYPRFFFHPLGPSWHIKAAEMDEVTGNQHMFFPPMATWIAYFKKKYGYFREHPWTSKASSAFPSFSQLGTMPVSVWHIETSRLTAKTIIICETNSDFAPSLKFINGEVDCTLWLFNIAMKNGYNCLFDRWFMMIYG